MKETKKKNFLLRFYEYFSSRIMQDHVGAYASQGAFFLILSFIPFMMLMLYMVQYTPLTQKQISDAILTIIPTEFSSTVSAIIRQIFQRSAAVLPVSIFLLLWSAGKLILSLMYGLDTICRVKRRRNYFVNRALAMLYTLLFVIVLLVALIGMVFGQSLQGIIEKYVPNIAVYTHWIFNIRIIFVLIILALLFLVMYCVIPNRRTSILIQIPGAIFATAGWELLSIAFSLYLKYTDDPAWMYGNLTTVILLMIWIYYSIYAFLLGAEFNKMLEEYIQKKDEPDVLSDTDWLGDTGGIGSADADSTIGGIGTADTIDQ
ncbi:MAG: YihY/virulence factor BrkB family protein [Lachnospiraceae bacterium]|nr:YihY/virulence factor BrkB family protein [Lachnospiraceae bacterium]